MREHLEAMKELTTRRAGSEAFRVFIGGSRRSFGASVRRVYKAPVVRLRMNLYAGKQRAFANFFNQLGTLEEDERQRLVVAYGAGRWAPKKETTSSPTTRVYKECPRRFVTTSEDEFRTSYTHHELGCTLQGVEIEKRRTSPDDIQKYGALTEEQMERRAKIRGLGALVSTTTNREKRMEFVNRDFIAVINKKECTVLENTPPEWIRQHFVGQPLNVGKK